MQFETPYDLYPLSVTNELAFKSEVPLDEATVGTYMIRTGPSIASVRGRISQKDNHLIYTSNRNNQDCANTVMAIVVDYIEPYIHWKEQLIDAILKYGDRLHTLSLQRASAPPRLKPEELEKEFHVTTFNVKLDIAPNVVTGDIKAGETGAVLSVKKGLHKFFDTYNHGVLCAKDFCVSVWKGVGGKSYCCWDPHPTGPTGKSSPCGAAALVLYSTIDELAETFKSNVEELAKPGGNGFTISSVKCLWEISEKAGRVTDGAMSYLGYQ